MSSLFKPLRLYQSYHDKHLLSNNKYKINKLSHEIENIAENSNGLNPICYYKNTAVIINYFYKNEYRLILILFNSN